jgi:hypothetical protein
VAHPCGLTADWELWLTLTAQQQTNMNSHGKDQNSESKVQSPLNAHHFCSILKSNQKLETICTLLFLLLSPPHLPLW